MIWPRCQTDIHHKLRKSGDFGEKKIAKKDWKLEDFISHGTCLNIVVDIEARAAGCWEFMWIF